MKTIVLIEDNISIKETYVDIINSSKKFEVIESFKNCKSALKEIKLLSPDIILLDIDASGMNSIDTIKHIGNTFPEIKIIVLTKNQHHKFVFDALSSGVLGYLIKNNELQIVKALEELEQGGSPMSNTISRMVVESFQEYQFKELSKRENEILKLLTEGKSYSNIAEKLYVSRNTVKYHLRNIYEKLNIYCRDEAIKLVSSKKRHLRTA
ncbi:response regulator transcription factor [uncultured Aquimarina sp.]|uniref:LuxR C-terminal-related transcriptional regulator n=1 Tax=uncultured Aquimarina sp. TaxID=575652 RepID=UPI0026337157|nr:response regulator transcription factor [uncultured Aquimarina sp.]